MRFSSARKVAGKLLRAGLSLSLVVTLMVPCGLAIASDDDALVELASVEISDDDIAMAQEQDDALRAQLRVEAQKTVAQAGGQDHSTAEVIVIRNTMKGKTTQSLTGLLTEYNVQSVENLSGTLSENQTIDLVTLQDDTQLVDVLVELNSMSGVTAQLNYRYELIDSVDEDILAAETLASLNATTAGNANPQETTNDPSLSQLYHLGDWGKTGSTYGANVYNAWDIAHAEDTGVTIAVLDTGCLATHEDLAANVDMDHARDIYNNSSRGYIVDYNGHGTHVCGIAAAVANNGIGVAGSSYNATVLPLKVFTDESDDPGCYTSDLIKAYDYLQGLMDSGELNDLHVINMSLGGYGARDTDDIALSDAIANFRTNYNVVTVCAGGNGDGLGNPRTDNSYPSDYDASFAVTCLTSEGGNAVWSDYNNCKDISAAGYGIYSTYRTGGYASLSGTSMASPLVAGIMSLLFALYPDLTADEACEAVTKTAVDLSDRPNFHSSSETGSAGGIDAAAALEYTKEHFGSVSYMSLRDADFSLTGDTFYTGSAITPTVTGTYNGVELVEGVDYTVTYSNNVYTGIGKVVVKGIGQYRGTRNLTFDICYNLANGTGRIINVPAQVYTGSAITPNIRVVYGNKILKQDVDYTLQFQDNIEIGTAKVVVTGIGAYRGGFSSTFAIVGSSTEKPTVSNFTYDGTSHVVLQDTDAYTITSGTGTVTDAGDYSATLTLREGKSWSDLSSDPLTLTWTVSKAKLTATYTGSTVMQGEKPVCPIEITGWVGEDNETNAADFVAPYVKTPSTNYAPGTKFLLAPRDGAARNYTFAYRSGYLEIVEYQAPEPEVSITVGNKTITVSDIAESAQEVTLLKKGVETTVNAVKLSDMVDLPAEFCCLTITTTDNGEYTKWYPTPAEVEDIYLYVNSDGAIYSAANQAEGGYKWVKNIESVAVNESHNFVDETCAGCGLLRGDINNSGKVNIVDAQIAYDLGAGKFSEENLAKLIARWGEGATVNTVKSIADVNNDGKIDAVDAFAIQYAVHHNGKFGSATD